jgi:hypothetical protein
MKTILYVEDEIMIAISKKEDLELYGYHVMIALTIEEITSYGYLMKHSSIKVLDAAIKMAIRMFESQNLQFNFLRFPRLSPSLLR